MKALAEIAALNRDRMPAGGCVIAEGAFYAKCRFNPPMESSKNFGQVPFPCIDGYSAF